MKSTNRKNLKLLLTPSMLSGGLSVLVALILLISSIIISLGKAGKLKDDLFAVNYVKAGINTQSHLIAKSLDSNHFISTLPLYIFWAAVGLIAYLVSINVYKAIYDMESIEKSLHYVHSKPQNIIHNLELHLAVRAACLLALWIYLHIFFKNLLPYCLAVVRNATLHWTLSGYLNVLWIFILLVGLFHILTVLVRMIALKARFFSKI